MAFDLLALGDARPALAAAGRAPPALEQALAGASGSLQLTPCSRERALAEEWFHSFEGAGLDGVVAKHEDTRYQPGKRAMVKVKHARTADCVVAGFRWHKQGPGTLVGSLLLGLWDAKGALHHLGVTSTFTMARAAASPRSSSRCEKTRSKRHPWRDWAALGESGTRVPGMQSRWSAGKDLSWEPLRCERVCEVKYDHLQGERFRHAAVFLRWRPDKRPADCRYDQLEVTPPAELAQIFGRT